MARATVALKDPMQNDIGVYPVGEWGEIIANENSIVERDQSAASIIRVVTSVPPGQIRVGGNAWGGLLSSARSAEAAALSRFFFEHIFPSTSAISVSSSDPYEFSMVGPREIKTISATVKHMGRAAPARFEE